MRDKGNLRTRGPHGLDSIVVGYYRGKELVYVARTRNGFVPASQRQLFEKLREHILETTTRVLIQPTVARPGDPQILGCGGH